MSDFSEVQQKPPQRYYSSVDYGPTMRYAVPKPATYFRLVGEALPAPNLTNPDYYEYRKVGYEPEHNWSRLETKDEYQKRMEEEITKASRNLGEYVWSLSQMDTGYPSMAATIVRIGPCWIYALDRKL